MSKTLTLNFGLKLSSPGTVRWPPDCSLKFVDGHPMGHCDRVLVGPLEPGQIADISVEMVSPAQAGDYQGVWRMSSASGHFFGGLYFLEIITTLARPRIHLRILKPSYDMFGMFGMLYHFLDGSNSHTATL